MGRVSRGPKVVPGFDRLEARAVLSANVPTPGDPTAYPSEQSTAEVVGQPVPTSSSRPLLVAVIDSGINLDPSRPIHYRGDSKWLDLANAYDAVTGTYGQAAVTDSAVSSPGTRAANFVAQGIADAVQAGGSANVQIVPIRMFDPKLGFTPPYAVVNAIYHAINIGAGVIELGYVASQFELSSGHRQQLEEALAQARSAGTTVVVAAANGFAGTSPIGVDIDEPGANRQITPADAHLSNMLVVASTDASGQLAPTSNWGAIHVDLGAPVYPTDGDTSSAAGYASGVAGVVAATRPDWSGTQVANRIKQTVKPSSRLTGKVTTGGVISPSNALRGIAGASASRVREDYEGDLTSDLTLFGNVAPVGYSFNKLSSTQGFDTTKAVSLNNNGNPFGVAGSIPVPGRYEGGPVTQPAVLIPSNGGYDFAILATDAKGNYYASTYIPSVASPGEIPVAGDFTGSGRDDLAL